MDTVLDLVQPYFAQWGYVIVFLAVFLENATFVGAVVPGDIVLLVAGVYSLRGALELHKVMLVSFAGAALGDMAGYAAGRFAGRWIIDRFGKRLFLPRDRLARMERYFERYGAQAVFLGRFAPVLRTIRTFVAGMSRMSFWRFAMFDVAGAAVWACVVPLLGFLFAESLVVVRRSVGAGGFVILLVLVVVFWLSYRTMTRRLEDDKSGRKR